MDAVLRNPGNLIEHVRKPGLGIDIVELGGDDEGIKVGGTLAATVGASEQPRLAAKSED